MKRQGSYHIYGKMQAEGPALGFVQPCEKSCKTAIKKSEYPEGYSDGPSVEIRTQGLLNPIQARYQTSPHPDVSLSIIARVKEKSKRKIEIF